MPGERGRKRREYYYRIGVRMLQEQHDPKLAASNHAQYRGSSDGTRNFTLKKFAGYLVSEPPSGVKLRASSRPVGEFAAMPSETPKSNASPPPRCLAVLTSLESAVTVARRLDRSVRTVDRYVEVGILPEPLRIRGRRFWPAGVMPKFDAA